MTKAWCTLKNQTHQFSYKDLTLQIIGLINTALWMQELDVDCGYREANPSIWKQNATGGCLAQHTENPKQTNIYGNRSMSSLNVSSFYSQASKVYFESALDARHRVLQCLRHICPNKLSRVLSWNTHSSTHGSSQMTIICSQLRAFFRPPEMPIRSSWWCHIPCDYRLRWYGCLCKIWRF